VLNNSFDTVFMIGLSESEQSSQDFLGLRQQHSVATVSRQLEALFGMEFVSFGHD